jgi:hypothetical protein
VLSVVASVLGVAVAISFGFTVTTLVALGCYVVALLSLVLGRWPQERAQAEPLAAARAEPTPA